MFEVALVALIASLGLSARRPDLHGLSTHYGPPAFVNGDIMADGSPLDLDAPTVAVDESLRDGWLGCNIAVLTECGTFHRVRVTDTGKFYAAGQFRYGVRGEVRRYWPVTFEEGDLELAERVLDRPVPETDWMEDRSHLVVLDFPEGYFSRIACEVDAYGRGETMKVWAWLLK